MTQSSAADVRMGPSLFQRSRTCFTPCIARVSWYCEPAHTECTLGVSSALLWCGMCASFLHLLLDDQQGAVGVARLTTITVYGDTLHCPKSDWSVLPSQEGACPVSMYVMIRDVIDGGIQCSTSYLCIRGSSLSLRLLSLVCVMILTIQHLHCVCTFTEEVVESDVPLDKLLRVFYPVIMM